MSVSGTRNVPHRTDHSHYLFSCFCQLGFIFFCLFFISNFLSVSFTLSFRLHLTCETWFKTRGKNAPAVEKLCFENKKKDLQNGMGRGNDTKCLPTVFLCRLSSRNHILRLFLLNCVSHGLVAKQVDYSFSNHIMYSVPNTWRTRFLWVRESRGWR